MKMKGMGSMTSFTHFNQQGRAQMVDISAKQDSARTAVARALISVNEQIYRQILDGTNHKGDVLAVAQVAGIMAAKNTANLIPMCHPIPLSGVNIEFHWQVDESSDTYILGIDAEAKTVSATGVEMEALTAATVAALTVYDMCKSAGKGMVIQQTMLQRKTGGVSGDYTVADPT